MKKLMLFIAVILSLFLLSCSRSLEGTYSPSETDSMKYKFENKGRVFITPAIANVTYMRTYKIDGDYIYINNGSDENRDVVRWTIEKDGSLLTNAGLKLIKISN